MTTRKISEYIGQSANEFAKNLVEIKVDFSNWETLYRDSQTGEEWIMDSVDPEYHGGGTPRLRLKQM